MGVDRDRPLDRLCRGDRHLQRQVLVQITAGLPGEHHRVRALRPPPAGPPEASDRPAAAPFQLGVNLVHRERVAAGEVLPRLAQVGESLVIGEQIERVLRAEA